MFSFSEYLIKMYIIKAALVIPEPKINDNLKKKQFHYPIIREKRLKLEKKVTIRLNIC